MFLLVAPALCGIDFGCLEPACRQAGSQLSISVSLNSCNGPFHISSIKKSPDDVSGD